MTPIRWGIIGAGDIARRLSSCFAAAPQNVGYAIASRSLARAQAFAAEFAFPVVYGCYEELVADPEVAAVYIATPHPQHLPHAQLALRAGKPTLCEKPFTVNAAEARTLIETARASGVFLMEAMWTRFFPAYQRMLALLAAGEIGALTYLSAEIGFRSSQGPTGRLFSPALAGGALLDVGVYPLALAADCFRGQPERLSALAHIGETGVDERLAMSFGYAGGAHLTAAKCPHAHLTAAKCPHAHLTAAKCPHALSSLRCSIRENMAGAAHLLGDRGEITMHAPWWACRRLTVQRAGQAPEELAFAVAAGGYEYQLEEFARCLRAGERESARMTLADSLAIMETLDAVRAEIGLRYPCE